MLRWRAGGGRPLARPATERAGANTSRRRGHYCCAWWSGSAAHRGRGRRGTSTGGLPGRCSSRPRSPRRLVVVRSEHIDRRRPGCRNAWRSTLGVAGELSAPLLKEQQRRRECWISVIPTAPHRPVVVRICYGVTRGGRYFVTGSVFGLGGGMANSRTFPRSLARSRL